MDAEAVEGNQAAQAEIAKREIKAEEVQKVAAVIETKKDPMEGMRVKVNETPMNRPAGIP